MHISFEEDLAVSNLEDACRSISDLLRSLGVNRLSCFHMNGFAWRDAHRANLEEHASSAIFMNVTLESRENEGNKGQWKAEFVTADALADDHILNQLSQKSRKV